MKTATITLHSAHNNGSFLQSFALQRKIISMEYDNEIINYIPLKLLVVLRTKCKRLLRLTTLRLLLRPQRRRSR